MSLKSLLQVLCGRFYSRQDSAEVAALALPSGQVVSTQTVTSSQIDQGVIAPCNGYATLYSDTGSATSIVLASGGVRQTTSFTVAGPSAWLGLQVPVRKGANVAVRSYPTTATIQFISLFGGGANRAFYFLRSRGGALWLRLKTSLVHFLDSSRQLLLEKALTSMCHQTHSRGHLLRQVMESSGATQISPVRVELKRSQARDEVLLVRVLLVAVLFGFLLKRVTPYVFGFMAPQMIEGRGLGRTLARNRFEQEVTYVLA